MNLQDGRHNFSQLGSHKAPSLAGAAGTLGGGFFLGFFLRGFGRGRGAGGGGAFCCCCCEKSGICCIDMSIGCIGDCEQQSIEYQSINYSVNQPVSSRINHFFNLVPKVFLRHYVDHEAE